MVIPSYQEFMNPVLQIYADQNTEVRPKDMEKLAADAMNVSAENRLLMVKSELNTVVYSRVHWATYYLYMAGLLDKPRRGFYKINDEGRKVLASGDKLSDAYLMKYPSFADFMARTYAKPKAEKQIEEPTAAQEDPEERLSGAITSYNEILKDNILEILQAMDSTRFEFLVKDFMEQMKYGDGIVTKRSNDGGIDVIINEDELGLSKIYLQAKRHKKGNNIGRPELQGFSGSMDSYATTKGVFITTSAFIKNAIEYADSIKSSGKNIILIDGMRLADLMIKHNIGVRPRKGYEVKEIDNSFFED